MLIYMKIQANNERMKWCVNELKKLHIQSGSNSMQIQPLSNEEKRVSFVEIPFTLTHGPDPPFMEIEMFNLVK